jgi:arylformamidase
MCSRRRTLDLTHRLGVDTSVSSGYPPVRISTLSTVNDPATPGQRSLNSSHLSTGLHCGTHMDAPYHFFAKGMTIDRLPLEHCMGRAVLLELPHKYEGHTIDEADVLPFWQDLQACHKVIIKTGWYHRWGRHDYFMAHPFLSAAAARLLVDWGVHLVGIDTPSVDYPPNEAHVVLLGNSTLIIENLTNLDGIPVATFDLIALPLAIAQGEASPVRAIATWTE